MLDTHPIYYKDLKAINFSAKTRPRDIVSGVLFTVKTILKSQMRKKRENQLKQHRKRLKIHELIIQVDFKNIR
jgi:hypothetical protein